MDQAVATVQDEARVPPARDGDLFAALAAIALAQHDAAALLAPGRDPLTFGNLLGRVIEMRTALAAAGVTRGDRIVSALPDGADAAVCFFGVAACATYAPLNPEYTVDEFARYLDVLRPRAVIVPAAGGAALRAAAARHGVPVLDAVIDTGGTAGVFELEGTTDAPRVAPGSPVEDDIALILLTSGTTARPKLVPLRHRHLTAMARASAARLDLGPRDRYLHTMPMFHGHGLKSGLLSPLLAGCGVICAPFVDVASFFEHLSSMGATWYSAGYTTQHAIADRVARYGEAARRANLRFIVSGAGRIERKVVDTLESAFGAPVIERYSTSETCVLTSELLPPRVRKPGTVGTAVINEIRVVDARGAALGPGGEGEIQARGPCVFDGYLDDPALNAQAFVDGWFRTGDVGRLDDDGYLTITGRIKEMINRGGEKIAPAEVERVIASHPAVAAVCVVGIPHPTLGEDVAAAIVPAQGALADERAIIAFAQSHLASFKVPRRIAFTAAIPHGATGKPDRRALSAMLAAQPSLEPEPPALLRAEDSIESAITTLWQELLRVDRVRRDVDFFAAGGDSLKIAEMVVALKERLDVRVSLRQIVDEGATVVALSRLVERIRREQGRRADDRLPEGIVALKADGDRTPLFALPGSDGRAGSYVHFCRMLDPRQPLYAIESRGLDGSMTPLDRMEDIAADNIARMRAVQPDGPYHLIGACFGGRVAYEMARQLEASGARVAFLALLDPSPPFSDSRGRPRGESASRAAPRRGSRLARFVRDRIRRYARELRKLDWAGRRAYVSAKARMVIGIVAKRDLFRGDAAEFHQLAVYEANQRAGRRYVPGIYGGAAILVFTAGRPVTGSRNYRLDWLELLPQCGVPRTVPGRDTGDMLVPPNVSTLAARINEWLGERHAHEAK